MNAAAPDWPVPESVSPMLQVEFAEATDCGPTRRQNEDFIGHLLPSGARQERQRGWIFALADGVGGQERGEVASRLAVETFLSTCEHPRANESASAMLARAIQSANQQVYEAGGGAMATTLVACTLRASHATVAHAGDSRCYLLRRGRLRPLTRDHNALNDLPRGMSAGGGDSRRSALSNTLTRSLGSQKQVSPEIHEYPVIAGDLLLLCSDGLHGAVSDAEIGRIAGSTPDLREATGQLIAIANQKDGGDNVSIQLIRVAGVEALGMYRGRPYRLQ